jgi:signal transduction histidine kinase
MSSVVVIAVAVVAVIGFVKARKIEIELEHVSADVYRQLDRNQTELHQRVDQLGENVFSQLDSRLDKLENKLITKK